MSPTNAARLVVGAEVLAAWKGGNFYPGRITKVHKRGGFDIAFEDGTKEQNVNRGLVQFVAPPPAEVQARGVGT